MNRRQTAGDQLAPLRLYLREQAFRPDGGRRRAGLRVGNERTWIDLTDLSSEIAVAHWGDRAPHIEERWVRSLLTRSMTPTGKGRAFRCVLAALGVPLWKAFALMKYWPDLRFRPDQAPAERLFEAALAFGMTVSVTPGDGPGVFVVRVL